MFLVTALFVVISLVLSAIAIRRDRPLCWEFPTEPVVEPSGEPIFETVFDFAPESGIAHSPAIVTGVSGFRVLWFQGHKEAAPDVRIMAADIEPAASGWTASDPAPFITSPALGPALEPEQLVVTLGNTIQNTARADGLFATIVSVGGWSMASIADVMVEAGRIVSARKLNLSPVLNRSHLVKSDAFHYADGSLALPAYFEMASAHGVLVRTDPSGCVVDRRLIRGRGLKPIQPMIVTRDAHRAVAFLRNFGGGTPLLVSHTEDGGQSWSEVERTEIPNADGPISALPLADGRLLLAMNDLPEDTGKLRLLISDDLGKTRREIRVFGKNDGGTRYPMLRRLPSGEILLAYSSGSSTRIEVHLFNDAWLDAQ